MSPPCLLYLSQVLASVFASATASIVAAAREGGQVGVAVAALVLLNASFALPVFAMLGTSETELSAFAAHTRRLATHRPPPPRRRPPVLPHDAPHDAEGRGCPKPQPTTTPASATATSAREVTASGTTVSGTVSGMVSGTVTGTVTYTLSSARAPSAMQTGAPRVFPSPNP